MFNVLGFSFLFHLIVVALWWVVRGARQIVSIAIVVGLSGGIAWSAYLMGKSILHSTPSTYALARNEVCLPRIGNRTPHTDTPLVVLRLDDVQANAWSETSRLLLSSTIERGIPMVAGVIPKGLFQDVEMANFLQRERCNLEIALHGWDHGRNQAETSGTPAEFQYASRAQAMALLKKGTSQLERITDEKITTFVPPNNIASAETISALQTLGFTVTSSEGNGVFDYTAPTYDFNTKEIVSIEHILTLCERNFSGSKPCIIMFHPQEYSKTDQVPNLTVIQEHFIGLLDALDKRGVDYVTLHELQKMIAGKEKAELATQQQTAR
ncbi:MAG: DUF2334 domain-containing protein [Candidatus Moraniibacteriota bacterium]